MLGLPETDETYLEYVICNGTPIVIFLVLKAKVRVGTKRTINTIQMACCG